MIDTKKKREGYARLLDAWSPPQGAGEPIGCVATSFTFSPVFFEEECLGRFLQLDSDALEDGPLYLIEREEKLSQVLCATALVDQHHCRGARSMRWDLLTARVPGALLHAKISLLSWARVTRLIVASANLTEDGYRRNQEVFGYLDFYEGSGAPHHCLEATIAFLKDISEYTEAPSDVPSTAKQRLHTFLKRTLSNAETWGTGEDRRAQIQVQTLFSGPGRDSCLEQFAILWSGASPPIEASVYSPFFDEGELGSHPASLLWGNLRQRGRAAVHYFVPAEELDNGVTLIRAPEVLLHAQPEGRGSTSTSFHRIRGDDGRPFHAKGIRFEDDRRSLYMIGSSNFTRRGLGLSYRPNIEANLVYQVDGRRNRRTLQQLMHCWPDEEPIELGTDVRWQRQEDEIDDLSGAEEALPIAFSAATYRTDDQSDGWVILLFSEAPPAGWMLHTEDDETFLEGSQQSIKTYPCELSVRWEHDRPPSGFRVTWSDSHGTAWWPINVESPASLPPPEELKSLPLDVLISVLTSARPLHVAIGRYIRKGKHEGDGGHGGREIIDPHKRVDTSGFLLQRTRRVSWALNGLRARLQRPAVNEQCLEWRLRGPVGVRALADALIREATNIREQTFLLSELILELVRVEPATAMGCLPVQVVRSQIDQIIQELSGEVQSRRDELSSDMAQYIDRILEGIS